MEQSYTQRELKSHGVRSKRERENDGNSWIVTKARDDAHCIFPQLPICVYFIARNVRLESKRHAARFIAVQPTIVPRQSDRQLATISK